MNTTNQPAYLAEVAYDLFRAYHDEDGSEIDGEAYYVQVTLPNGRRWVHNGRWQSLGRGQRDRARANAENLLARINAALRRGTWAGPHNNQHWQEVQPAYGSPAYAADWQTYAAADELADGNFEPGSRREGQLRDLASQETSFEAEYADANYNRE